jgi:hypothetical protein
MLRSFVFVTVLSVVISCNNKRAASPDVPETFAVIEERDLIPEGTAYDPLTEQVFISSTYKWRSNHLTALSLS